MASVEELTVLFDSCKKHAHLLELWEEMAAYANRLVEEEETQSTHRYKDLSESDKEAGRTKELKGKEFSNARRGFKNLAETLGISTPLAITARDLVEFRYPLQLQRKQKKGLVT
ncbi:MAG: hypothetical protein CEN90_170 [Parcubacteria group bacterium Licking1014_17]|nr:MAG: hypothetical protein CEN90_170 [Parcubacteria group bacterium Licking1014_17]